MSDSLIGVVVTLQNIFLTTKLFFHSLSSPSLSPLSLPKIGLSLGLWKIGAIAAYINTNLRHASLMHCLKISNATHLVCSANLMQHVTEIEELLEGGGVASGSLFYLSGRGGKGAEDGGKVGGAARGKNLELELENVTEHSLPSLADKSLSGK